jgi:hypothetical protein
MRGESEGDEEEDEREEVSSCVNCGAECSNWRHKYCDDCFR